MTLGTAADDRRGVRRAAVAGGNARDHVTALAAVVEDLAGQFDLRPLLERILRHAADLLGCDSGSICTVDQAAGTYRKEVDLGVACRSGAQFPLTEGVTGEILRAGGPVTFAEYADVRGGHIAADERGQLHATIGVPIRWSGSVIGSCIVFSRDRGRRFGADDVTLLELFAGHAGVAMANARLHAQAAELTRAEAAGLERERVVRDVHDSVARALASVVLHLDDARATPGPDPVGVPVALDPPRDSGALDRARRAARTALRETGRLDDLESGLQSAVEGARTAGLDIRLVVAGTRRQLSAAIAGELLTLGRRAVGDIVAHGDARTARVGLVFGPADVVLFVQDDGVGFDRDGRPRPDGSGLGLRVGGPDPEPDLASGAERLGGTVQIDATPGWGTTIRAAIPYPAPDRPVADRPTCMPSSSAAPDRLIRALIVEHRPLITAGVLSVLQADRSVHVVGQTVGAADTLAAAVLLEPDVVLIDAALPAGGAHLTAQLRARARAGGHGVGVLALGERNPAEPAVQEMIRAGADAVVLLGGEGGDILDAVRAASTSSVHRDAPAGGSPPGAPAGRGPHVLTPREQQVRALVCRGMPDKAIAATLNISVKTVEKHVGAALRKTGARNRTELASLGAAGTR
jgi:DNA-binding NarL/FixJ family response regulator/signal transduction histidine kinase